MDFIKVNLGTIFIALVLVGIVVLIVRKLIADKKKGISIVCGCKCSDCSDSCESKQIDARKNAS
jgi:hypothetical protein